MELGFLVPTAAQLRAARAWVGWSLDAAAEASGIHRQTISRIESGASEGAMSTLRQLVSTYAAEGISFEKDAIRFHPDRAN